MPEIKEPTPLFLVSPQRLLMCCCLWKSVIDYEYVLLFTMYVLLFINCGYRLFMTISTQFDVLQIWEFNPRI